jgi:hypothetical protein
MNGRWLQCVAVTTRAPVLLAWLCAASAWAQAEKPNPHLAQAVAFYDSLEFEQCLSRLQAARAWHSSGPERVQIELYTGLCNHSLRREREAHDAFARAVALDPAVELPPFSSPKTVALLAQVKAEAPPPPPAKAPAAEPVALQPPPSVSEQSRTPHTSLWVGVALVGVGALSAGAGVFMGVQARRLELAANAALFESDIARLGAASRTTALGANAAFGAAAAAALIAAIAIIWGLAT